MNCAAVGAAIVLEGRLREGGRRTAATASNAACAAPQKSCLCTNSCFAPLRNQYRQSGTRLPITPDVISLPHRIAQTQPDVRPPSPVISISPAPAISATSAAIRPATAARCAGGRIFRSNHLGHLTEDDVKVVRELGVKQRLRFSRGRGAHRRGLRASRRSTCIRCRSNRRSWRRCAHELQARALSSGDALEIMRESYRGYVRHNTQQFPRRCLRICWKTARRSVIHCTAGKDRTGFACALMLHALGVPEDVIAEDYLLTNRFYRRDPNSAPDLPDRCQAGDRIGGSLVPRRRLRCGRRPVWRSRRLFPGWASASARASAPNSRSACSNPRAAGRLGRELLMAIVDHFAGRPILAAEPGEHRAVVETVQDVLDAVRWQVAPRWQAARGSPAKSKFPQARWGVGEDTNGIPALAGMTHPAPADRARQAQNVVEVWLRRRLPARHRGRR